MLCCVAGIVCKGLFTVLINRGDNLPNSAALSLGSARGQPDVGGDAVRTSRHLHPVVNNRESADRSAYIVSQVEPHGDLRPKPRIAPKPSYEMSATRVKVLPSYPVQKAPAPPPLPPPPPPRVVPVLKSRSSGDVKHSRPNENVKRPTNFMSELNAKLKNKGLAPNVDVEEPSVKPVRTPKVVKPIVQVNPALKYGGRVPEAPPLMPKAAPPIPKAAPPVSNNRHRPPTNNERPKKMPNLMNELNKVLKNKGILKNEDT